MTKGQTTSVGPPPVVHTERLLLAGSIGILCAYLVKVVKNTLMPEFSFEKCGTRKVL